MIGEVGILNVGAGDTKLSFDPKKPAEVKRACAVVSDMLKRGYAIFVEVGADDKGPLYRRATSFDPKTAEYIIAGGPEDIEVPHVQKPSVKNTSSSKGRAKTTRVPAATTRSVAVARTAGG